MRASLLTPVYWQLGWNSKSFVSKPKKGFNFVVNSVNSSKSFIEALMKGARSFEVINYKIVFFNQSGSSSSLCGKIVLKMREEMILWSTHFSWWKMECLTCLAKNSSWTVKGARSLTFQRRWLTSNPLQWCRAPPLWWKRKEFTSFPTSFPQLSGFWS